MKNKVNYSDLSDQDLRNRLQEMSEELLSARRKARIGQFKKFSEFPRLRREVARIRTHLRTRELTKKESA